MHLLFLQNFMVVTCFATVMSQCNLKKTFWGGTNNKSPTEFVECRFSNSNMVSSAHGAAKYLKCHFENNNLNEVNFDGARFEDCIFTGLMESVEFRRFARSVPKRSIAVEGGECPDEYQNKMKECGF